jgi:hypothetical protein
MGAAGLVFGAQTALTLGQAALENSAIRQERRMGQEQLRMRARSIRLQKDDAIRRGNRIVGTVRRRQDELSGRQRVAIGAQGIDPRSGTPAAMIVESRMFAELDALQALNNAKMEAFGLEAEARSAEADLREMGSKSRFAQRMNYFGAGVSILGNAIEKGYNAYERSPSAKIRRYKQYKSHLDQQLNDKQISQTDYDRLMRIFGGGGN